MLRTSCFYVLFFCLSFQLSASANVETDSLKKLLAIGNKGLRDQKLVIYLGSAFNAVPLTAFNTAKSETDDLFSANHFQARPAFDSFIQSIYQARKSEYEDAQNSLKEAISWSQRAGDRYLVYSFYTHLGFLQSFLGRPTDAISSFRIAKKEAIALNDAKLQVVVDINISDLYYRYNFYNQSLFYVAQADSILANANLNEQRLNNAVTSNKAENYFRMGDLGKLKEVDRELSGTTGTDDQLYTFKKRTDYYILLLEQDFKKAVSDVEFLKHDKRFYYNASDEQYLADAYYQDGNLDSAKAIVNRLLSAKQQENHPEINFHLYAVLGEIAQKQNDYKQAAANFKLALEESVKNINRLTGVGFISSEIKADELEGFFGKKENSYKTERTWLTVLVLSAVLTLIIGAMFYGNIRQKRYYEKLLFTTQKEELAFINSHEVRRHLSNILGIIDTINHSEEKDEAYLQAEQHLLSAAKSLDEAIKNISEKLNE